jgi:hypothetical protein
MTTKHLTLAASMILFTAMAGQASARPEHAGWQHSTNAVTYSGSVQNPELAPGAETATQPVEGIVHHYTGGPKFND